MVKKFIMRYVARDTSLIYLHIKHKKAPPWEGLFVLRMHLFYLDEAARC